ncbi:K02A2.6-like [Cordylochernes scorpioides]|uniref:K02A2.6-like n=1 Tax=Cordylochernes scorpioides TaxID=51811 RepID=A0ABY6KGE8_9ARAC|nr:K02A2.6-like [Cordylochernes scorpioides]
MTEHAGYTSASIKYKSGKELLIADLLSRDCKSYEILEENPIEILLITAFDNRSTTNIMKATKEDAELQELKETIIQGWPDQRSLVPLSCRRYWNIKDELPIHEDLVLKGTKIIIPESIKKQVLMQIHEGHRMSKDISDMVKNCKTCIATQRDKQKQPLMLKEIPELPWEIVVSDIFQFEGNEYIICANIGQEVYLRENRRNWKPATIVREDGPRSYTVQNNKRLYRRNQSHITTSQSQNDHESILEQEPSGSACSTMEQDQETQPKGSDRIELQSETDNPAGEEETREEQKFTRRGHQVKPPKRMDL